MSSPRARRGSDVATIVLTIREKKARLKELEREARELRSQLTAARDAVGGPPTRGRRSGATRGTPRPPRPVWPSSIAGRAATALRQLYPNDFAVDKMQRLLRDPATLDAIRSGTPNSWAADESAFSVRREKYLLYR